MPMSQSASSSPTPRTTSRVMMTGLIGPDLRRLLVWSIARRLNAATHARRLFGATHAFNPKYNDFGFDSDQVSKLDNANLKTWPMSRTCHFPPPDRRLNYEPDWTRRMSALGQKRTSGQLKSMSALLPKADIG